MRALCASLWNEACPNHCYLVLDAGKVIGEGGVLLPADVLYAVLCSISGPGGTSAHRLAYVRKARSRGRRTFAVTIVPENLVQTDASSSEQLVYLREYWQQISSRQRTR